MSTTTVDSRVVELKFNNEQFEKATKESSKSLQNLNKSINSVATTSNSTNSLLGSLAGTLNATSSSLGASLNSISQRFSTMGIVGMSLIQNVTNSVYGLATKALGTLGTKIASVYSQIKNGGKTRATNIQKAMFQLEGLGIAWDSVKESIDGAVSGTAFGLDSAAKACGQLAASGIEVGDAMSKALLSISGVASMTDSEYDDIAFIYERIAGQGKIMATDLNSFASRGLNIAADLAESLGVSEATVRDMVSNGKIGIDDLITATAKYEDAAKKANNTVSGITRNIKSALSRIGEAFWTPVLANTTTLWKTLENGEQVFYYGVVYPLNAVREALVNFKSAITPVAEVWTEWIQRGFRSTTGIIEKVFGTLNSETSNAEPLKWMINIGDSMAKVLELGSKWISAFGTGWSKAMPAGNVANMLETITNRVLALAEALNNKLGDSKTLFDIQTIGKGLASALDILIYPLRTVLNLLGSSGSAFNGLASIFDTLISGGASISEVVIQFDEWLRVVDPLRKGIETFHTALDGLTGSEFFTTAKSKLEDIAKIISQYINLNNLTTAISTIGTILSNTAKSIQKFFSSIYQWIKNDGLAKTVQTMFSAFSDLASVLSGALANAIRAIGKSIANANFGSLMDWLQTLGTGGLLAVVIKTLNRLTHPVEQAKNILTKVLEGIDQLSGTKLKFTLDTVRSTLIGWQTKLKSDVLLNLGKAVLMLAVAMLVMSSIDGDKLANATVGMAACVGALLAVTKVLTAGNILSGIKMGSLGDMAAMLVGIAAALLITSAAFRSIGDMDTTAWLQGIIGLYAVVVAVTAMTKILNVNGGTIAKGCSQLILMSASLWVVAKAFRQFGKIGDWKQFAIAISGFTACTVELVAMSTVMKLVNSKLSASGIVSAAAAMIAMATSMVITGKAFKQFAKIGDWKSFAIAISGFTACLTALTAAMVVLSKASPTGASAIAGGASLLLASYALLNIAGVVAIFGKMNWKTLLQGALGLLSVVTVMSVALGALGKVATLGGGIGAAAIIAAAGAMLIMAVAMDVLAPAILTLAGAMKIFATIKWYQYLKLMSSFLVLGIELTVFSVILGALTPLLVSSGVGLAAFGAGLIVVGSALKVLATVKFTEYLKICAALLLLTTTVIAAGGLMQIFAVQVGIFCAALLAISVAVAAFGTGIALLGVGVSLLSTAASTFGESIVSFVKGLEQLNTELPIWLQTFLQMLVGITQTIADYAEPLATSIVNMIINICSALSSNVPRIAAGLLQFVADIVTAFAELIEVYGPQLAAAAAKLMSAITDGIINFFNSPSWDLVKYSMAEAFLGLISSIVDLLPDGNPLKTYLNDKIDDALEGIGAKKEEAKKAAEDLAAAANEGLNNGTDGSEEAGASQASSFISGLTNGNTGANKAGATVSSSALSGLLTTNTNGFSGAGQQSVNAYITSLSGGQTDARNAGKTSGEAAKQGLASVKTSGAGVDFATGYESGMSSKKTSIWQTAYSLAKQALAGLKKGQDSNSPSKLTMALGEDYGEGYALGISSMSKPVTQSATYMSKDALRALSTAVSMANDMTNDLAPVSPVITPSVNLSALKQGLNTMDSMLSANKAQTIAASVSTTAAQVTNADIVSAINNLQKANNNQNGGDTYNINGITYDDGTNVSSAVQTLIRAAKIERRI